MSSLMRKIRQKFRDEFLNDPVQLAACEPIIIALVVMVIIFLVMLLIPYTTILINRFFPLK